MELKSFFSRELRNEISSLKRELLEKQRLNKSLQQRVDELDYRLSTSTPSPASPFNPVFTQSPSTSVFGSSTDQSSVSRSTPSRSKFGSRGFREFDSIETPRENGTSWIPNLLTSKSCSTLSAVDALPCDVWWNAIKLKEFFDFQVFFLLRKTSNTRVIIMGGSIGFMLLGKKN